MKRRLFTLTLCMLFLLSIASPAAASEQSISTPSDTTVERVKDEVLTGAITSEDDVLSVALAQYADRLQASARAARSGSNVAVDGDASPRITQVLETTVNEDGSITTFVADTGLLVVDENGRSLSIAQLYTTGTGSFSEYDIRAQLTVYFYYKYSPDNALDAISYVKINRMTTTLYYDGSYSADYFDQYYCVDVDGIPVHYLQQRVQGPVANVGYTSYPPQADWELAVDHPYPGFSALVYVFCGNDQYEFYIDINALTGWDYTGTW